MSKFSMSNAFIRKLEGYGSLTELDKTLLSTASSEITTVPSRVDLVGVGKPAPYVHIILDGFALSL